MTSSCLRDFIFETTTSVVNAAKASLPYLNGMLENILPSLIVAIVGVCLASKYTKKLFLEQRKTDIRVAVNVLYCQIEDDHQDITFKYLNPTERYEDTEVINTLAITKNTRKSTSSIYGLILGLSRKIEKGCDIFIDDGLIPYLEARSYLVAKYDDMKKADSEQTGDASNLISQKNNYESDYKKSFDQFEEERKKLLTTLNKL